MATFTVKGRKHGTIVETEVEADTRERAIEQVVKTAGPGEEFEILQVQGVPDPAGGATGATGATGTTSARGATGPAR